MSDRVKKIELLPVTITKNIQHSWLEIEDHLKRAGNILFNRYGHVVCVCVHVSVCIRYNIWIHSI